MKIRREIMKSLSMKNRCVIGFTLFSMFFGAGNLIFPPLLGAEAGGQEVSCYQWYLEKAQNLRMAHWKAEQGLKVFAERA